MRTLLCAALALSLCASVFAQGDTVGDAATEEGSASSSAGVAAVRDEAALLLQSRGNAERAWGAYLAGRHELREHLPALVALIGQASQGGGVEEGVVRQAALDALIRLGAEVPADALRPLVTTSPDEVIILLAANPSKNEDVLLGMFVEDTPTARWLAIGNLLLETKARGFAPRLLKELEINARVWVYDGAAGGHGESGGYGCGSGGGAYHPPEGFPPVGYYSLNSEPARGAIVVAPGLHPVYYRRSQTPNSCPECNDCDAPGERDARRLEYLAGLVGSQTDWLGFETRPSFDIVCRDMKQCRAELENVRHLIEQPYAALVERLVAEEHLTADESAALPPDITFRLSDVRDDKSQPLPKTLKRVKIFVEE